MSENSGNSYDYMSEHTIREWGWEFIRRDERYIKEWDEAFAKYLKTPHQHRLWEVLMVPSLSQYSRGILSQTIQLGIPEKVDTFVLLGEGATKWGLNYYQNPSSKNLNKANYAVKAYHVGSFDEHAAVDEISAPADEHTLLSVIDLKKPIKIQIDEITKYAQSLQDDLRKRDTSIVRLKAETVTDFNKSLWIRYLQLIDLEKSGKNRKDAALILFSAAAQGADSKWKETKKQIQAIAKENYRLFMD